MSKRVMYILAAVVLLLLLWLLLRSCSGGGSAKFNPVKFEQGRDRLARHNANFLRRDGGGARYKLSLTGDRGYTCFASLRMPMTDRKVPGLVVLHTYPSDTTFFTALSAIPRLNEFAAIGLNVKNCFGSAASELMNVYGAAELCVDYLRGHNAVDTNLVFVAGLDLGALYVLPVVYLEQSDVRAAMIHTTDLRDVLPSLAEASAWATKSVSDTVLMLSSNDGNSWWNKWIGALPAHTISRTQSVADREALQVMSEWILGPARAVTDTVAVRPDDVSPSQVKKLKMN